MFDTRVCQRELLSMLETCNFKQDLPKDDSNNTLECPVPVPGLPFRRARDLIALAHRDKQASEDILSLLTKLKRD